jgi:membrane protease YdiL (CAAX protease family)
MEWRDVYETIDKILSIAAVAITLWFCARCIRGGAWRPLIESGGRASKLREDSVIAAVLAYLLGAMAFSGVARILFPEPTDIRSSLIIGNGAQIAGLIACLVIASKQFTGGARSFVFGRAGAGGRTSSITLAGFAIVAVGLCPLVRDVTVIAVRFFDAGHEFPSHATIVALGGDGVSVLVVISLWLGAALIAPLAEEAFFRGILQTFFFNAFGHRRIAIVLSSLAFGLVHFQQPQAIPALVVLGFILGYAYERSGSLIVPVMIHAVFNLKTLVWYAASGSAE